MLPNIANLVIPSAQVGVEFELDFDVANVSEGAIYSYSYYRNGEYIAGAAADSYTPVAADQGQRLHARVSVVNLNGGYASMKSPAITVRAA